MLYFGRTSVAFRRPRFLRTWDFREGRDKTPARALKHVEPGTGLHLPLSVCLDTNRHGGAASIAPRDLWRCVRSSVLLQRKVDAAAANGGSLARPGSHRSVQVPHSARSPAADLA